MSNATGYLSAWNGSRVGAPEDAGRSRTSGQRQFRQLIGEIVLTATALVGLAVTAVTVLATTSGVRPLVVRSGSMAPTIPAGSMVLVRRVPAPNLAVSDIVAVERPDHSRVTHRIVAIEHQGKVANLTLKGDANEDVDPAPVMVTAADRLLWQVPAVGRAAAWLATAPGGFAMGCLATWALCRMGRRPALRRRHPKPAYG